MGSAAVRQVTARASPRRSSCGAGRAARFDGFVVRNRLFNSSTDTSVNRLTRASACPHRSGSTGPLPRADASVTTVRGKVCAIMTADCLPVLLAARPPTCTGGSPPALLPQC